MWKIKKRVFDNINESFHPIQFSTMHAQDGAHSVRDDPLLLIQYLINRKPKIDQ